ncbi:hypothetical protein HDU98_000161 [Podochytrium sp. JEL0797]|nr:hypothetical protein HDU98_000161 [Podochytrium sp. JEL0797]
MLPSIRLAPSGGATPTAPLTPTNLRSRTASILKPSVAAGKASKAKIFSEDGVIVKSGSNGSLVRFTESPRNKPRKSLVPKGSTTLKDEASEPYPVPPGIVTARVVELEERVDLDSPVETAVTRDLPKEKEDVSNFLQIEDTSNLLTHRQISTGGSQQFKNLSYTSLRMVATEVLESVRSMSSEDMNQVKIRSRSSGSRGSSLSSLGNREHPIIQWINRTRENIMNSTFFKVAIGFLAADRTKILLWYFIVVIMHAVVTAVFIISLWVVMPGIWVYNLMQLFVIACSLIAFEASSKLSNIVRTSIAAGDLLRGRLTISQIADYWVKGPKAPAQKVIRASALVEVLADIVLLASSIMFSWRNVETKLMTGQCIPPFYEGTTLPQGIDIHNYVQGDIDFAEVYNYGLPLADGLVGGWAGWPMADPLNSFQINGEGPIYVMQVLCDNGVVHPEIDPGIYTLTTARLLSQDNRGFMLAMSLTFPPNTVYDDVYNVVQNTTVIQDCTVMMTIGYGTLAYHFVADQWQMVTNGQVLSVNSPRNEFVSSYPSSIHQYSTDAHNGFQSYGDKFGVLPILQESVVTMFENGSFSASQGAVFCNLLSEGTLPDGFYHSMYTYRGVAVAIGAAAHYAIMQYAANATLVDCDYFGFNGSGMLSIPIIAIQLSAAASALACLVKAFEIMWWFMAQNAIEYEAYRRARRSLRHPFRFAMDAAEMLSTGMQAGENEEDVCDLSTMRAVEELGNTRIMYGEDMLTRDMEVGHLRIGENGKIKSIVKDKKYGTYRASQHPEWDEFIGK